MSSIGEINSSNIEKNPSQHREDLTDVYISVFFDGTSNNMYYPENKRNKIRKSANDDWEKQEKQASQPHIISTDSSNSNSNANDKYSNVAILYSLSKDYNTSNNDSNNLTTAIGYSIYVEGSGAMPFVGSNMVGAGFGVGKTGVVALVSKAIRFIYDFLASNISLNIRKTIKLHFALFGFSRGATCARVLANLITRDRNNVIPRESEFAQYLNRTRLYNNRVCFLDDFNENNITVDFLGIFDTVSSIGFLQKDDTFTDYGINSFEPPQHTRSERAIRLITDASQKKITKTQFVIEATKQVYDSISSSVRNRLNNDKKDLSPSINNDKNGSNVYVNKLHNIGPEIWGDAYENYHRDNVTDYGLYSPSNPRVKNTFHICALDEFRENFALVNLGRSLNNRCAELFIPGCHSDIGGGYMDGDLLVEYNLRTSIHCHIYDQKQKSIIPTKLIIGCPGFKPTSIDDMASLTEEGLIRSGWYRDQGYNFIETITSTLAGKHNSISIDYNGDNEPDLIKFKRFVREGYSNIALEAMKNRAMSADFGLGNWPKRFQPFDEKSTHIRFKSPNIPIAERILNMAKQIKGNRTWIIPESIEEYRTLRSEYLHFTSTDKRYAGLAGNPIKIWERVTASGANMGNPPNWHLLNIEGQDVFVLCRLMYNGDLGDRALDVLFNLRHE